MKHIKFGSAVLLTILLLLMSACQNADTQQPEAQSSGESKAEAQVKSGDEKEVAVEAADLSVSTDQKTDKIGLPEDFPMPADAVITTSHVSEEEGKLHVLLIYKTKAEMDKMSAMYRYYFKGMSEYAETVDHSDLIFQAVDEERKHDWSLIGGTLSYEPGVIEMIVNFDEL